MVPYAIVMVELLVVGKGRVGDGIGGTICSSDSGAIGSGKGIVGGTICSSW